MNKSRRTSFVDMRRKSFVFQQEFEPDSPIRRSMAQNKTQRSTETISMEVYKEALRRENTQWREVLQNVQSELKSSKHKETFQPCVIDEVDSNLTQEFRDFLDEKPDYKGIIDQVENYLEALRYGQLYQRDLIDHYDHQVEKAQQRICKVFDASSTDGGVCGNNCDITHHKLDYKM